jgi:hypothetical protein
VAERLVERQLEGAVAQDHEVVPQAERLLHPLEGLGDRLGKLVALDGGHLQRVAKQLANDAELVRVLVGRRLRLRRVRRFRFASRCRRDGSSRRLLRRRGQRTVGDVSDEPVGLFRERVELKVQRLGQQGGDRLARLEHLLADWPPRSQLRQDAGRRRRLRGRLAEFPPLAAQVLTEPPRRGRVARDLREKPEVAEHHVRVPERPQAAPQAPQHPAERPPRALGQHRLQEVQRRLEPPGGNSRLVDGLFVPLFQGFRDVRLKLLQQGVDVRKERVLRNCGRGAGGARRLAPYRPFFVSRGGPGHAGIVWDVPLGTSRKRT